MYAALRLREPNRPRFLDWRERQGICPLVSQTGIDTPVWRASPAGPRQGIDSGFPSPSHPRRKAEPHVASRMRLSAQEEAENV
jgi:hypothetical protein